MRKLYGSVAGIIATSIALSSCSAPDRLRNDDISIEASKDLVRERLISPIDDERTAEFNKRIPRRSILQVIHSPQSLSDASFLRVIENQLSDELNFRELQDDLAGEKIEPAAMPQPISDEEKAQIRSKRDSERKQVMVKKALILEEELFGHLTDMEPIIDDLFLNTVPLRSNIGSFPDVIGANLTEDPNGYLSLPSNVVLIGGGGSTFTSKTAALTKFVQDKQLSLSVRDLPIEDAIGIIADSLGIEYTFSLNLLNNSDTLSLSLRSNGLAILDAILSQHELAIMYDTNLEIARFYRDEELVDIHNDIKNAIRGHNELLKAKKELDRAQTDVVKIKEMIDITQRLLSGNYEAFNADIKDFPRSGMGTVTRQALKTVTEENLKLARILNSFDEETESLIDPTKKTITNKLRQQASGLSLSDMLVESDCVVVGKELFVEKIAVYNVDASEAVGFLTQYFDENESPTVNQSSGQDNGAEGNGNVAEGEIEEEGDAANEADAETPFGGLDDSGTQDDATNQTAANRSADCPEYAMTFQEDSTGIIVKGRRFDNSLAVRLIEEYDIPRLQVLVEIFMVTVSRDFNRQISNLITRAANSRGGNDVAEAVLDGSTITAPSVPSPLPNVLTQISSAISGGYSVRLNSPGADSNGSLISSALGFIESNQLGRVLSSPTILVENGTPKAIISRTQEALVSFPGATTDNGTSQEPEQIEPYDAKFSLELSNVAVYPANRTVNMGVKITNERFVIADIQLIENRDEADKIVDIIDTTFTASPGDVIVLAGLSANSEGSKTAGLPGTTGALAPVTPLLGGTDQITSNASEMIIFLAPTVIDPAADFQPHSAFGARSK